MTDTRTDAELVVAARAGDSQAFAAIYDRYADRVYGLCTTVTRDRGIAEDATAETFVSAWNRLEQLREPAQLRAWLFAIARNRSIKLGTRAAKLVPVETLADTMSVDDATAELGADDTAAELQQMVWDAAAGLNPPERAVLDLQVRQGLEESEIAQVMGIAIDHTYVLTSRMRKGLETAMGALFIARKGRADCAALDAVLAGWDGTYSPLIRKRVNRHIEQCETCESKKRMVNPFAAFAAAPALAAPAALRERVLGDVQHVAFKGDWKPDRNGFPQASAGTVRRIAPAWFVAAAAMLLIITGIVGWSLRDDPAQSDAKAFGTTTTTVAGTTTTTSVPEVVPTEAPSSSASTTSPSTTATTAAPESTTTTAPDTTNPRVQRVIAAPSTISKSTCITSPRTMTVTVTATDDRAIVGGSITATIGGAARGTYPLSGGGSSWTATVGPFPAGTPSGSIQLGAQVVDAAGNTGSGRGSAVLSATCT